MRGEGKYANVPPPDVIFLDLFLPKVDGLTVLKEIKSTPSVKHIPVVVASASDNPADIRTVYDLNGNCYIRKPDELYQFLEVIETSFHFWGALVNLKPKVSRVSPDATVVANH